MRQVKITKTLMRSLVILGMGLSAPFILAACQKTDILNSSQTFTEGYVIDPDVLATVPVGSSRDQVMLALGSPSLTAMYDDEVFYYISQTRYRSVQFMKAKIVDRRILAIYFDKQGIVKRIANYGLQDGKVFDFVTRTTPTGGSDSSFIVQLIRGSKATPAGLPTTSR